MAARSSLLSSSSSSRSTSLSSTSVSSPDTSSVAIDDRIAPENIYKVLEVLKVTNNLEGFSGESNKIEAAIKLLEMSLWNKSTSVKIYNDLVSNITFTESTVLSTILNQINLESPEAYDASIQAIVSGTNPTDIIEGKEEKKRIQSGGRKRNSRSNKNSIIKQYKINYD